MRRHPFDPVALVFGLTFAAAAIVVLAGGSLYDDGELLLPACLLALGAALLVQAAARNRSPRPTRPVEPTADHDIAYGYTDDWSSTSSLDGGDLGTDVDTGTVRSSSGVEWTGPPDDSPEPDEPTARPGD